MLFGIDGQRFVVAKRESALRLFENEILQPRSCGATDSFEAENDWKYVSPLKLLPPQRIDAGAGACFLFFVLALLDTVPRGRAAKCEDRRHRKQVRFPDTEL